jgi:hypothetical protein
MAVILARAFLVAGKYRKILSSILAAGFFILAVAGVSHTVYASLIEQKKMDTRTAAYNWIITNIPATASILHEAYCPQLFYVGAFNVGYAWTISDLPFNEIMQRYDFVVVSEAQWERYRALRSRTYEEVFQLPLVKEWTAKGSGARGGAIRLYSTGRKEAQPPAER